MILKWLISSKSVKYSIDLSLIYLTLFLKNLSESIIKILSKNNESSPIYPVLIITKFRYRSFKIQLY